MIKKYKIALFCYSQTGQARAIADSVCRPFAQAGDNIVCKEITPEEPYPFPWSAMDFFQVFPESRLGIPCRLKTMDLSDVEDADLVIIAGQSWYLSWSVPLHAFFQSDDIKNYLRGRDIIVTVGCRNMWTMTQRKAREYIREAGGRYVGFISLQDKAANLVSVITIIRWLFYNKKEATRFLPVAGVSLEDINHAEVFGKIIREALERGDFTGLQAALIRERAVTFLPTVYFIEKNGYRLWGQWAKFITGKGTYKDAGRTPYLRLFCVYLFFVLYVVSPVGMIFFFLTYPFRRTSLRKAQRELCYELN
ncbi:MAG: hypothetical protein LBC19_04665 [Tannerella sp.]|jgi:hypothetical protein|nr:hypothetical protein [Tannerella sp.]